MEYKTSYRKKDKGYQAIVSYKTVGGRWRQRTKQGYNSVGEVKKGCDKLLTTLKEEFKRELLQDGEHVTFGDFTEVYFEDVSPHITHNSMTTLKVAVDSFGKKDTPMRKIGYSDAQGWVNGLIDSGYKYNTIKTYVALIKTMFSKAVKSYKVIYESPLDSVTMPKKGQKKEIRALSQSELNNLLSGMNPEMDYIICLIASHCGLRIGEIIGITTNSIDLKNRTIKVDKQWKKLKKTVNGNAVYGFGKLKSKNSYRTVPIPPIAIKSISEYILSTPIGIDGRIFPEENPSTVSRRIIYKAKKIYPDLTFHSLRHTYATILVANGIDFKTIALLLGDTVAMVLEVYSHVTDDMVQTATEKISDIFM